MLSRSGIYYAAQHLHRSQRVTLPLQKISTRVITPASCREELGVVLRLWFVIVSGVAFILVSSWLVSD